MLGVTPAAIGQSVRRLERTLGLTLLHRTTRRMQLTVEGRAVLERARALVTQLGELAHVASESRGLAAGPLRVSAPSGVARRHLPPLLAAFAIIHPEVSITLDASDALRDLVEDGIDVAFRVMRPRDGAIVARPISRLEAVTVASPSYLARRGVPKQPSELASHDTIGYRHPTSGAIEPATFRMGGRDRKLTLSPRVVVNDVDTGCALAVAGAGIAQPPSDYAAEHVAAGRLVPLLTAFVATPWTLYLCYRSRHVPARVRIFIDFALHQLGRDRLLLAPARRAARRGSTPMDAP